MAETQTADLAAQLAALRQELADLKTKSVATTTADERLEAILTRSQQASATAMQIALRKDNPNYPGVSVFNPDGSRAKPRLTRETHWVGTRVHEEELLPREVELFNALQPGTYHGGKWLVKVVENKLFVWFPNKSMDERMDLPSSMVAMLSEMVHGIPAQADPAVLIDRIAQLERDNAMLLEMAELKTAGAAA